MKSRDGQSQREEKSRREKIREEKDLKKEEADARKGRKVAKHCVLPMICGSGGSKSRLAKAAGAEPAGQMRAEKLHAVVVRSTFRSQHVQNTPCSDHFWKLRCRKKCIPLWRVAHFEVKMYKTHQLRTTFRSCDVEKVHAVLARSTFRSQKCKKMTGTEYFWTFRCASPSYDLASIFRGRRSTLDRWSGKIAKRLGKRPSALHSTFDF